MKEFINQNLPSIIAVFVIAVILLGLWYAGKKSEAKKLALSLVVKAEAMYTQKGAGQLKYQFVADTIYKFLPYAARLFISKDDIDTWIEDGVAWMKETLSEGLPAQKTSSNK